MNVTYIHTYASNVLYSASLYKNYSVNAQMCFLSQKWARAFCDQENLAAVDTNNGVQALNKALKHSYLPKRK